MVLLNPQSGQDLQQLQRLYPQLNILNPLGLSPLVLPKNREELRQHMRPNARPHFTDARGVHSQHHDAEGEEDHGEELTFVDPHVLEELLAEKIDGRLEVAFLTTVNHKTNAFQRLTSVHQLVLFGNEHPCGNSI